MECSTMRGLQLFELLKPMDEKVTVKRVNITLPINIYEKLRAIADERSTKHTILAGDIVTEWVNDFDKIEAMRLFAKSLIQEGKQQETKGNDNEST